jgi:hypothetical protein
VEALTSPVILFFLFGCAAAAARSDLTIPEPIAKGMSLYLMAAIGLKGGVEVGQSGLSASLAIASVLGVGLSCLIPLGVFAVLRTMGRLGSVDAGAIAAHYGSVSVVTFVAGTEFLTAQGIPPAGYMVAVMALMETPAIIVGLMLARRGQAMTQTSSGELFRETALNGTVVLLLGSFAIGAVIGRQGFASIAPVFETGFRGVLCLFLLDMGLIAVRKLRETRALTARLAAIGVLVPLVNGVLAVVAARLVGLDVGSTAAFGILAASASYIAVPAAMRLALPEANSGLSLAMSLAVTFPFNILVGIALFSGIARWLA